MAGVLSSSVKAPVTAVILMAEMTGSLTHFMPVVGVAFTVLFVSDMLRITPIYEALVERIFPDSKEADEYTLEDTFDISVEKGSFADGRFIRDINWPRGSFKSEIKRDGKNIIPRGRTLLREGDYITVVNTEHQDGVKEYYEDLGKLEGKEKMENLQK